MGQGKFRLVAIDLDGTLVDAQNKIAEEDAQAVREAAAAGIEVVLASGRMHAATAAICTDLGIENPVVAYNGARVTDMRTGEVIFHQPLEKEHAAEIIESIEERGLHLNLYLDDVLHVREIDAWGKLYAERTGSVLVASGDLRQFVGTQPTKLLVIAEPERIKELYQEYAARYGEVMYVTITNPEYLEFMNKEVSKGKGLAKAAEYLGVPREQVLAIGDGFNDKAMLEWAGTAVAMGNAVDEVKAVADVVAPPLEEHGVAWAIRELLL